MELYLARVKVFLSSQNDIFARGTPSDILRAAINERPTSYRVGPSSWHIGNVEEIDVDGLYFALGRTARSSQPILDQTSGNFIEAPFDRAPYTHVFVDTKLELVAIAQKYELAPSPDRLCHALAKVLQSSDTGRAGYASFACELLSNPDRFLSALQSAYAIRSFTVTFTRPNPFDVNRDFQAPMERLVDEAEGERGSTTISGAGLKPEPLEDLTRSAAATGENAKARLVEEEGNRPVVRSLRGNAVSISVEGVETASDRRSIISRLRGLYQRIRFRQDSES